VTECPRRDKWFRPCRFEARYDLSPVEFPKGLESLKADTATLQTFRHKTYVGDVCVTCGKVVHPMMVNP
jgi:hypothetical protein